MSDLEEGIKYLEKYNNVRIDNELTGFQAFRALMNITMPIDLSTDFYRLQDKIIHDEYEKKKIVLLDTLIPFNKSLYLYKGDITILKVSAIVNACNSKLLGCFHPLHNCVDNAIHSYAGLQVRRDLMKIMEIQNYDEPTGECKVTYGYNLPSKYIFHTVGPIVNGVVTANAKNELSNCYKNALKMAIKMQLDSIAFPCISTGIYSFPNELAAEIAIKTVKDYLKENNSKLKVVFVVYKDIDYLLYERKIKYDN